MSEYHKILLDFNFSYLFLFIFLKFIKIYVVVVEMDFIRLKKKFFFLIGNF